ncbi:MFS transporter [Arthrobacter sp. AOP36-A1-22]|nr:MFS transporter [Micrococcaceae bacterium]MDN5886307.1 MFS transporter [Micrococcaceae bacterium]MDN6169738.1 MFS transporter [Micrococcaceae bacterium]MDN6201064.1 MFS transporter [Micrococcaceae bacterium]
MSIADENHVDSESQPNPFRRLAFRQWYAATTLLAVSTSTMVAVTLALVDVTASVALAGLISGLILGIELLVVPIGGGLADVISRRTLLRRALFAALAANTVLVALLTTLTLAGGEGRAWIAWAVVVALVVSAGAAGIADPALDASARSLIKPPEFPRAMSAEQARSSTLQIVGSPASGGLYALIPSAPFMLRVLCDLGFLLTLRHIRQDLGPVTHEGLDKDSGASPRRRYAQALLGYREALSFLRQHRALRRVLVAAPLVNLMVFSGTSWTVLHLASTGVNALTTGITVAGFAVGGLIGSAIAPALTDRFPPGPLAIVGLSWMTAIFAGLFLCDGRPWTLFVLGVLAMLPSPALNGGLFAHVFAETSPGMQGRVMATFSLVGGLATVAAPIVAGAAIQARLDATLGVFTCAIGALGVLVLLTSPAVRAMPRP